MAKKSIIESVKELLAPYLAEHGIELWNAEFVKTGKDYNLNVYIDKEGGIGLDDCEMVSRYLSDALDEAGTIEQQYYLIVSSPGMDRQLLTDEHFVRYAGEPVDVSLYRRIDGKKQHTGLLVGRSADEVIITNEETGDEVHFPADAVSKVRLSVRI